MKCFLLVISTEELLMTGSYIENDFHTLRNIRLFLLKGAPKNQIDSDNV